MKIADMMDLTGKLAIVTGGGGIFGKTDLQDLVRNGRESFHHAFPFRWKSNFQTS